MTDKFDAFTGEFHAVARLTTQPGKASELVAALGEVRAYDREHVPGVLGYEVLVYGDEVCVLEKYKDQAAVAAHASSEVFQSLRGKMKELLVEGGFSVKCYESAKL